MKKKLSMLLAVLLSCSIAAGCKTQQETPQTTETSVTQSAETTEEAETEQETVTATVYFDEEYDPLDENYDPYGGNVGQAEASAVTAATKQTEAESSKEDKKETEAPDGTKTGTSVQKTEEKITEKQTEESKKEAEPAQTESDGAVLELNVSNGWENGSDKFIQLDGAVKNNQTKTVSGWTAVINADSGVSVDQSWNCSISVKNGKITVEPVDYNKEVSPGNEVTFGMILKNAGTVDPAKSTLKYGTSTAAGTGNTSNSGGNNNNNNSNSGSVGNNDPEIVQAKDVPAPTTDDWLYVKGNKIYDKDGKEVWLTGVNWFGYNTGTNTFDGLWACDLNTSLAAIADRGFNLLRIPISSELIKQWSNGEYPNANFNQATNSYLVGMNSLEIFDYVVGQCRANGLKIMIDIHSAKTDSMGHMKNVWYEGSITEKDFLDSLAWMSKRYKSDDTIIAYDLKNEPHGKANESPRAKWDNSKDADNWKYIAEKAANSVLSENPNVLVMVEGIEIYPKDIKTNGGFTSTNMGDYYCTWWGGNLRGVKDNPVDLGKYQNKLVYSPHDYGPSVYQQPWFQGGYSYESLYEDCWHDNWLYIHEENIAPLLIGEWGGFMQEPNLTWMTYLRKLIKEYKLNHTFWCFNSNSGDTGGLVKDDFKTWDEEKYSFVKEVLWQQNGKFVGLDHEIPLGNNGITLSEAK